MKPWGARRRYNWLLLLTLVVLGGLGLVNLSSASRGVATDLALVQGIWFGGCLLLAVGLSLIDYRLFERLAYPLFFASLLALVAVLAFGRVINNSKRWIDLGLFNFQPSEVMKIALILVLAKYFDDDAEVGRRQSIVARILVRLHPLYPLAAAGLLIWQWSQPQLAALGSIRWAILFGCAVWEVLAVYHFLTLGRGRQPGPPVPAGRRGYTLDDLIKPSTPLYPLGAAGALILFWEQAPLAVLGGWRFVALGVCLVWAATSAAFAVRAGRTAFHDLVSPVILVILPAVLIMRQPDLGTALVLLVTAASIILFVKVRLASFLITAAVLAVVAVASWSLLLEPYQQERIEAFISPAADTKDTGYHSRQSIIAVGSGRMSGKGYGESTQTQFHFLPEQHTDFVFSVWAEEQGFVGCVVVLLLYLFLLVQLVNIASTARDRFGLLCCVGLAALVFWHVFINIGMVIGLLPVVGLTLPLWSYGGSSVLALMAGFGLVLSIAYHKGDY